MMPNLTRFYNERRDGATPSFLIVHGTAVDKGEAHKILSGQTVREVSCHYMIDQSGQVTQYLDESVRAWHAGISYWEGITDINSHSIGMELECLSHNEKFDEPEAFYTDAQMQTLITLAQQIIDRHNIPAHRVLAHQDVAPGRKADPGPHFDWTQLAQNGVGLWHGLQPADNDPVIDDSVAFIQKLDAYGYDTSKELPSVIRAFQTHFLPWNICGQVTEQSVQALDILLEKKSFCK